MEEKQNAKYLLKLFIPGIALGALDIIICGIILADVIKDKQIVLFLSCLVVLLLFFGLEGYLVMKWANRRIGQALQSESPQPLISISEYRFFSHSLGRFLNKLYLKIIPGLKTSQVIGKAMAYTYWGQFDQAREELRKVEWEKQPPMYQSLAIYIKALHEYLERNDFKQGMELAKDSYRLVQLPSFIPGRNWFYRDTITLIEIGQILNENPDATTMVKLEAKFKRGRIMIKPLIAWALEKAYNQMGKTEQANQMRAYLNQTAPHCIAFAK
jgi:tetratricopeptide (TPR) repeat protein